jgi:hypothetical protein
MTRYLTISGLVLAAALVLVVLSTTPAGAVEEKTLPAYFATEGISNEETVKIDGEQIGSATTLTVGSQPALTCSTIKYSGAFEFTGPVSEEEVPITPEFTTCHVVSALGTKTTTVAMNGCTFRIEPTATITESEAVDHLGDTDIACPEGKTIEITVFNTSSAEDKGAETLCKYTVSAQSNLSGITFTNKVNTPSTANDIVADFNLASIKVVRTTGSSFLCGAAEQTATYKGEATLRGTNAGSEYVDALVKDEKFFRLADNSKTVGGAGIGELQTEKKRLVCNTASYEMAVTAFSIGTLQFKPSYSGCFFGSLNADVKFEGCEYKYTLEAFFHFGPPRITTATFSIVCGGGKTITVEATDTNKKVICTVTLGAQTSAAGSVSFMNGSVKQSAKFSDESVILENKVSGLEYEVKGDPTTCGQNKKLKDGALEGSYVIKATDHKSNSLGIRLFGSNKHL